MWSINKLTDTGYVRYMFINEKSTNANRIKKKLYIDSWSFSVISSVLPNKKLLKEFIFSFNSVSLWF